MHFKCCKAFCRSDTWNPLLSNSLTDAKRNIGIIVVTINFTHKSPTNSYIHMYIYFIFYFTIFIFIHKFCISHVHVKSSVRWVDSSPQALFGRACQVTAKCICNCQMPDARCAQRWQPCTQLICQIFVIYMIIFTMHITLLKWNRAKWLIKLKLNSN